MRATAANGLTLGDFAPGDQIGDFVVDSKLPSRGTGIVYAGHHVAVMERQVIIRVMPVGELFDEIACALDDLDHPGMPRIFGSGVLFDKRRWVAVERIAGSTLADVIAHRTMSQTEMLALLRDVSNLLARVHACGIMHGNLRPENIVVPDDKRSAICLTGWEGALRVDSAMPAPFLASGTEYTAPEQMIGEVDDPRTDMFALGVIAHRALYGVMPGQPRPKAATKPTLVETLIEQMLCARADLRPTSARLRAAVSWLCSAGEIDKRESWIVPTVAMKIDDNPWQIEQIEGWDVATVTMELG